MTVESLRGGYRAAAVIAYEPTGLNLKAHQEISNDPVHFGITAAKAVIRANRRFMS